MARIDIFLDLDEVLKGKVFPYQHTRDVIFEGGIRRLNRFIEQMEHQGHVVTIVPVTSHREDLSAKKLRRLFESLGLKAGLPFMVYRDGPRISVVTRRLAQGATDAYVIFDDNHYAYPKGQPNLIAVRIRAVDDIPDDYRGITAGNIVDARAAIRAQLAGLAARPAEGPQERHQPKPNDPKN